MKEKGVKKEMDVIRKAMKTDKGYYMGWQANIAMAFCDEMERSGYRLPELNKIANKAAVNFLNLLIKHSGLSTTKEIKP